MLVIVHDSFIAEGGGMDVQIAPLAWLDSAAIDPDRAACFGSARQAGSQSTRLSSGPTVRARQPPQSQGGGAASGCMPRA
eukprot:scaffold296866_cov35-Tisochrysis_lutea.AAC.2